MAQAVLPEMPTVPAGTTEQVFGGKSIGNISELLTFGLDAMLTLVLAALIIFHPTRRRMRHTLQDLQTPHLFFFYALIGLAVGFLVIQHGYIIGFVIFGIGTLMRFRSSLDNPTDTVEVILVTVMGLTVGLGLPIMAILFGLVGWALIWLKGRTRGFEVTLQGRDDPSTQAGEQALKALIGDQGWTCISRQRNPAKQTCQFILVVPGTLHPEALEDTVTAALPEGVDSRVRF